MNALLSLSCQDLTFAGCMLAVQGVLGDLRALLGAQPSKAQRSEGISPWKGTISVISLPSSHWLLLNHVLHHMANLQLSHLPSSWQLSHVSSAQWFLETAFNAEMSLPWKSLFSFKPSGSASSPHSSEDQKPRINFLFSLHFNWCLSFFGKLKPKSFWRFSSGRWEGSIG